MNYKTEQQFCEWNKLKIAVQATENKIYFKEGQIWWIKLGLNIGHEQDGKNENYERPVVILKKFNEHIFWAVPLSTKVKSDNPYYHHYNFGTEKHVAILSQLRLISSKRLSRKIGQFPMSHFEIIRQKLKKLI